MTEENKESKPSKEETEEIVKILREQGKSQEEIDAIFAEASEATEGYEPEIVRKVKELDSVNGRKLFAEIEKRCLMLEEQFMLSRYLIIATQPYLDLMGYLNLDNPDKIVNQPSVPNFNKRYQGAEFSTVSISVGIPYGAKIVNRTIDVVVMPGNEHSMTVVPTVVDIFYRLGEKESI